jgi:hypothetical protein
MGQETCQEGWSPPPLPLIGLTAVVYSPRTPMFAGQVLAACYCSCSVRPPACRGKLATGEITAIGRCSLTRPRRDAGSMQATGESTRCGSDSRQRGPCTVQHNSARRAPKPIALRSSTLGWAIFLTAIRPTSPFGVSRAAGRRPRTPAAARRGLVRPCSSSGPTCPPDENHRHQTTPASPRRKDRKWTSS